MPIKNRNSWGLHDTHGNVWEWCLDDYVTEDGALHPNALLPSDGSARQKAGLMTKVLRGGSWSAATHSAAGHAATRFSSAPSNATNDVGFRLVLRLP